MIQSIKNVLSAIGEGIRGYISDPIKYSVMVSYKILCIGLGIWIILYITSFVLKILGIGA